jgi:hypothetical protein
MFNRIRDYLNRPVHPAPNPLQVTIGDVDAELAALTSAPGWRRDDTTRVRADRLLDVRDVLHSAFPRQRRPSTASFSRRA